MHFIIKFFCVILILFITTCEKEFEKKIYSAIKNRDVEYLKKVIRNDKKLIKLKELPLRK